MFFNTAYARLWELDESFLQGKPHLGDVLEALRERRRFPEYPNFPAYKREVLQKYVTLIAQEEELVHLPDGSTLRMVVTPRSEEHTSELQSLMRISYAVFCLKKKIKEK